MLGYLLGRNNGDKFGHNRQSIAALRSTGTTTTAAQSQAKADADRSDWQGRVLLEFNELSVKVSDLKSFTTDLNATWAGLPIETRQLMLRQLKHMQGYQAALAERIKGFDLVPTGTAELIAADYGLPGNACTCGPGDGCTACGTTNVQLEDPTMAISELEIGREFRITVDKDGPLYTAVGHSNTPQGGKAVEAIHLRYDNSAIHLAIPLDQRVFPVPVVPDVPVATQAEPPKVIVPTVGRKVWFYPNQGQHGLSRMGAQPFDATIVYVHGDRLVNLLVVDHLGESTPFLSVQLVQPGDDACSTGHRAEWMPYQVKTAGKA